MVEEDVTSSGRFLSDSKSSGYISDCFLLNAHGDLPFLFHVFEENTTLQNVSKFK